MAGTDAGRDARPYHLAGASNQLGDFESGALAWFVGAVPAGIVGGSGAIIASPLWAAFYGIARPAAVRRLLNLSKEILFQQRHQTPKPGCASNG
jgi:hypothetical protein